MSKVPLSAQISALRTIEVAGGADRMMRGGIVARRSEGELLHERLIAARVTLEFVAAHQAEFHALLDRIKD